MQWVRRNRDGLAQNIVVSAVFQAIPAASSLLTAWWAYVEVLPGPIIAVLAVAMFALSVGITRALGLVKGPPPSQMFASTSHERVHDRLTGRRVGLASFGEIHRHLARFLGPFDTEWQAFDPFVPAERIEAAGGTKADDLVAMAARSEIFFIATPPNPTTLKMINAAVIDALPVGAVFVLVSRMAVVDQGPLIRRLQAGELRAAIDVYDPEPPELDSPLRSLPNVIHTPHRAGLTAGAHHGVFTAQCLEAQRFFAGESLRYPLRPELVRLFEK